MSNSTNGNLLKIANRVLKIGGRVLRPVDPPVPPTPQFDEVKIGSQTWMSKNLAIDDGQGGIYSQTVNYGHGDVVEYYYTWYAAVRVANAIDGWHFPTVAEYETLANKVGSSTSATKLKSTYGWNSRNGTDNYGFSAFPAGKMEGGFYLKGEFAYFWTATPFHDPSGAAAITFDTYNNYIYHNFFQKTLGFSVRLIKD